MLKLGLESEGIDIGGFEQIALFMSFNMGIYWFTYLFNQDFVLFSLCFVYIMSQWRYTNHILAISVLITHMWFSWNLCERTESHFKDDLAFQFKHCMLVWAISQKISLL